MFCSFSLIHTDPVTRIHTHTATVSYLFGQQAVHDEDQRSLQAVEDSESICNCYGPVFEHKGPKHPHQTKYTHLGDSCHRESSVEEKGGGVRERPTDTE